MNSVEHRSASIKLFSAVHRLICLICFVISVQVPWENSDRGVLPGVFDLTSAPLDPLLHLRSSALWAELSGESVMDGTLRREAFSASCLTEPWSPCD